MPGDCRFGTEAVLAAWHGTGMVGWHALTEAGCVAQESLGWRAWGRPAHGQAGYAQAGGAQGHVAPGGTQPIMHADLFACGPSVPLLYSLPGRLPACTAAVSHVGVVRRCRYVAQSPLAAFSIPAHWAQPGPRFARVPANGTSAILPSLLPILPPLQLSEPRRPPSPPCRLLLPQLAPTPRPISPSPPPPLALRTTF